MVSEQALDSVESMFAEMSEVINVLYKISADITRFSHRREQVEARQEQVIRAQKLALRELQDVVHGGKRTERDKGPTPNGSELYSPLGTPLVIRDLMILSPPPLNVHSSASTRQQHPSPNVSLPGTTP